MWVQKKLVPRHGLFLNIPLHVQELNYEENIYELEDHVGEKALSLNLLPTFGHVKKTLPTSFPSTC